MPRGPLPSQATQYVERLKKLTDLSLVNFYVKFILMLDKPLCYRVAEDDLTIAAPAGSLGAIRQVVSKGAPALLFAAKAERAIMNYE